MSRLPYLRLTLKLAFSAAVISYLYTRFDASALVERIRNLGLLEAAAALAIFAPYILLQVERMRRVAALIHPLPFDGALTLTWIGAFFNQTLPSAVGGDVFRVWYLRARGFTLEECIGIALADRALGLLAMLLLLLAGLPWFFASVSGSMPRAILALLLLGGFGAFAALGLSALLARLLPEGWRRRRALQALLGLAAYLRRAILFSPAALVGLALSLAAQMLQSLMAWYLGYALGLDLAFAAIVVFLPLANIATMLPISIAGWGLREAVLVGAFGMIGITAESAFALSVLIGLVSLAASLPGLPIWLARRRQPKAETTA